MREKMIDEYRPVLDNIANKLWGGSCVPYRTNKKGIRYFSCNDNSGYIVDSMRIPKEDMSKLTRMLQPHRMYLGVQMQPSGFVVIGVDDAIKTDKKHPKRLRYDPELGRAVWVEYPVFIAAEDDGWCVVEKITGVRVIPDEEVDEEEIRKHDEAMERCFQRHLKNLERR